MGQLEGMFYAWADDQEDGPEVNEAYEKMKEPITKEVGEEKYYVFYDAIMQHVTAEKKAAFKGGFRQATVLWKEVG